MIMSNASTYAAAASIGPRFTVAGVMLGILAAWMNANHDDAPFAPIAAVGVVAAMSFAWGLARLRIAQEEAAVGLVHRSGSLAMIGAVVLAAVAVWWTVALGSAALGEVLGLTFFALIAASTGIQYLGAERGDGWDRVRSLLPAIGFFFLVVGATCLGLFLYLTFTNETAAEGLPAENARRLAADWIPETVGLLFSGFALFFGGLYLYGVRKSAPDSETLKWAFLVIGVMVGGVIGCVSLARIYTWGGDLFRLGTFAGPEAWKFWTIAYEFLFGVVLILAALGAAFSRSGSSEELRRSYYLAGAIGSAALLLAGLGTFVVLVYSQAPFNFSWSKSRGVSVISGSTKNLLAGLEKPVKVYAVMNSGTLIYDDLSRFLANCKFFSNQFDFEFIDPDRSPEKFKALATRFTELKAGPENPFDRDDDLSRGVLIIYGQLPDDVKAAVPHAFIPAKQLVEQKQPEMGRGDPSQVTFLLKAETEITKEIASLTSKGEKRKVYFLQGDEELDFNSSEKLRLRNDASVSLQKFGVAAFVDKLKKDRFEVAAVSFGIAPPDKAASEKNPLDKSDKKDIVYLGGEQPGAKVDLPKDCTMLIIPGPSSPIPQAGLDALERFMDGGGRLIAYLDVFVDRGFSKWKETGLEGFLRKYGVDVANEVVLRLPQQHEVGVFGNDTRDPTVILAETPRNPKALAAKFADKDFAFWTARVVKPGNSVKYQADPLLVVPASKFVVWADDSPRSLGDVNRYVIDLIQSKKIFQMRAKSDIPVAVSVSEGPKPRMVVFGDVEFISNFDISGPDGGNYDLARGAIEWMSERSFVGPSPKETSWYALPRAVDFNSMIFGALWTMLVAIVLLGGGVWLIRRK